MLHAELEWIRKQLDEMIDRMNTLHSQARFMLTSQAGNDGPRAANEVLVIKKCHNPPIPVTVDTFETRRPETRPKSDDSSAFHNHDLPNP